MLKKFKYLRSGRQSGSQISAGEYNRLGQSVVDGARLLTPGHGMTHRHTAGMVQVDYHQPHFEQIYIQVNGAPTGSAYPWDEIFQDAAGTWGTHSDGRSGTAASGPAYEARGSVNVPVGVPFPALLFPTWDYLMFFANEIGGTTSSTSTAPTGTLVLPTLTTTGAPTWTAPEGSLVWNTVDNGFYVSLGGGTWVLINQSPYLDWNYFRQVGTSPLERWYPGCLAVGGTLPLLSPAASTLYAMPFIEARGGTADKLGIYLAANGAAGAKARWGIYTSTDQAAGNLYPFTLVVDAGEVAVDAGAPVAKKVTLGVAQTLGRGLLYWLVFQTDTGVAGMSVNALGVANMLPVMGIDNTLNSITAGALSVGRAYAALPATFPASATVLTTNAPAVFAHYSS